MIHLAWTGVGLVCGFVASLFVVMLWVMLAGAVQEWLCEVTLDRMRGAPQLTMPKRPPVDGLYSILVSDVHLDTWTYPDDPHVQDPNHPKRVAFLQFLEWLKGEPRIKDVYLNGDAMDFPPHPLNQPPTPVLMVIDGQPNQYPAQEKRPYLGSLVPENDAVLQAIGQISQRNPAWPTLSLTYVTGNHDIGLYGLRYIQPNLAWNSVRVAWNPSILLQITDSSRLYMEHGHLHDPFMWLYLRYAVMALLRGPEAVPPASGKVGMTRNKYKKSIAVQLGSEPRYFEGRGSVGLPPGEGFWAVLSRLRFRQAARRLFRTVRLDEREKIRFLTMGHTHLPDRYIFPGGKTYLNSGDWAGNDTNCTFLLIHPNGEVTGPHQWRVGTTLDALT